MGKKSLSRRLAISSFLVVSAIAFGFALVAWQVVSARIRASAAQEAARQSEQTLSTLAGIDQLTRSQVETGMRLLQEESRRKGSPSLKGTSQAGGHTVPNLALGDESQVENYTMVDHVKGLAGGTATLFAWNGSDFIRVTTNVLKPDGSRAVGTVLDSKGRAYAALVQGQAFHGVVDILGVPYTTSYVPMLDRDGKTVGAWYTGYRLDSIATLGRAIEEARILNHGFVALAKPSGAIIFHGNNIPEDEVTRVKSDSKGWTVQQQTYPAWGYTVFTAYPNSDVRKQLFEITGIVAAGIVVLVGIVVWLQAILLKRLVLVPVLSLAGDMDNADLNSEMETGRADEIGILAESFNNFVSRLRETLLQVRDGSAASTMKSNEIRTVSSDTVERMSEQLRRAQDASAAMVQLSQHIANTAGQSSEALEHARAAAEAAREGGELVASTVTSIQALAQDTERSASRVANLNQRIQQIGSIVGVIDEIASGTNLLALNASIEAARAGEQGRGFAVVAGEVRRLAERTAQATHQVATLVDGIQNETGQAAEGILAACEHAKQGAEAIACLNTSFEHIAKLVVEVDGRIGRVSEFAGEEASAADQVSQSMGAVASSAKESSSGAQHVVNASGELLSIAQGLETMVQHFNLREA